MKWIKELRINKMQPKSTVKYPIIRLPSKYSDLIGKKVQLFETEVNGCLAFMVVISKDKEVIQGVSITSNTWSIEKRLSELENKVKELSDTVSALISSNDLITTKYEWGRRDLNSGHRLPKPGG